MTSEQIVKEYEKKHEIKLTDNQANDLIDVWSGTTMSDDQLTDWYEPDDLLAVDLAKNLQRQHRKFLEAYNQLRRLAVYVMAKDSENAETRKTVRLVLNTVDDDEYIKLCLENNYPLDKEDKEKILELLK